MNDYLAYTSGVVRLFDTLEAANGWLAEVGGGEVFVAADQLAERTLQHRVQLDNAVALTARLAAAEETIERLSQVVLDTTGWRECEYIGKEDRDEGENLASPTTDR
jgi:hypothetical protein